MKKHLLSLYYSNYTHYQVWTYLWVHSDNSNRLTFDYTSLCATLKISKPTLTRAIKQQHSWNKEIIHTEIIKKGSAFELTFYPTGKKATKSKDVAIDKAYKWVKTFYEELEYDYPNITKHKRYVIAIMGQITEVVSKKNPEVTDELRFESFKLFMSNIPEWWRKRQFDLPAINRHFIKILNGIKRESTAQPDTNNKRDEKYRKAAERAEQSDYSFLSD